MSAPGRRAAFLDRDGTLIEERDYLSDPERVALVPGAARAVALLRSAGYAAPFLTVAEGVERYVAALLPRQPATGDRADHVEDH